MQLSFLFPAAYQARSIDDWCHSNSLGLGVQCWKGGAEKKGESALGMLFSTVQPRKKEAEWGAAVIGGEGLGEKKPQNKGGAAGKGVFTVHVF